MFYGTVFAIFEDKIWSNLSKEAKDFVKGLTFSPEEINEYIKTGEVAKYADIIAKWNSQ